MKVVPSGNGWLDVSDEYVASDGEVCTLTVRCKPTGGVDAEQMAAEYFEQFGRGVVESAKAAGCWPLPPDHPNHPSNA